MSSTYGGKTHEQLKRSRSAILGFTTKLELKLRPLFHKEKENVTADDLSYRRAVEKQLQKSWKRCFLECCSTANHSRYRQRNGKRNRGRRWLWKQDMNTAGENQWFPRTIWNPTSSSNRSIHSANFHIHQFSYHLKIPKFDLPKFNCQYKGWTSFLWTNFGISG